MLCGFRVFVGLSLIALLSGCAKSPVPKATFVNGLVKVFDARVENGEIIVRLGAESGVRNYKMFVHALPANPGMLPSERRAAGFVGWDHYPAVPLTKMTAGRVYEDRYRLPFQDPAGMQLQIGFFDEGDPSYAPIPVDGSSGQKFIEVRVK
jgi:hypothetical protein